MLVFSDSKMGTRKGHFWNGYTQGSFGAPMRATRKDVRNGLLGNGMRKVWGKSRMRATDIPDAGKPFMRASPLTGKGFPHVQAWLMWSERGTVNP